MIKGFLFGKFRIYQSVGHDLICIFVELYLNDIKVEKKKSIIQNKFCLNNYMVLSTATCCEYLNFEESAGRNV